jgi:hypothetical protein
MPESNSAGFGIYLIVPRKEDKAFAKGLANEAERMCYEQNN